MPALPIQIVTAQNRARGQYEGAVSAPVDFQRATASAQDALHQVEHEQKIRQEEAKRAAKQLEIDEARVHVINTESRIEARLQKRFVDAQTSGMAGFTDALSKDFDSWTTEEVSAAPSAAKPAVTQAMARLRGSANMKAAGMEIVSRQKQVADDFGNGLEDDRRLVYADPSQFGAALARRTALASSLQIPEDARRQLTDKAREQLAAGAALSMAENTPQQLLDRAGNGDAAKAAKAVASDPVLSNLSPEALRQSLHLARTTLNQRAAEGRYDVGMRTKDIQTMVLSGIAVPDGVAPTAEEYTKLHGASGPAMWQQEVGNYLQIGGAIQQMRTASAADREQIAKAQNPEAGPGFAGGMHMRDAVLQAKQLVEKQILADPATYAMTTSPRVQKFATAMNTVLSLPVGNPNATPEDRAAAVDAYVKAMESEQLRLGVTTIRDEQTGNKLRGPKILSNQQANAISDMFHDQGQGGANAAQLIQGLEQQWGKHWPKVYGQLAGDNKLPPAAMVIPSMPNDASRSRMAAVSALKPAELEALVAPGDKKDLNEKIRGAFEDAQRSFTAQGVGGNKTLAVVMDQAEKLAMLYRSQGKSVVDAAKQAYTETMGHAYQFGDTYRVPVKYDMKQIRAGADAAVESLVKAGGTTVFNGEAPQTLTDDALRFRSMWITNADESGLELRLRGADGGVYSVLKDGQPVAIPWADLTTRAKTAQVDDSTRAGNEEWMRRRQQELNPRR